jgi:hypothetical protein
MEIWKTTTESPLYEVSNLGNVRHIERKKILSPIDNGHGYKTWCRRENGKLKRSYIHRTVYNAFFGDIPEGMVINHINFETSSNQLSNLELLTIKQNYHHSKSNGRFNEAFKKQSEFMKGNNLRKNMTKEQEKRRVATWKANYKKENHGLYGIKGFDNPTFKYSAEQIREIKDLFNSGRSMNSIGKQVNIPYSMVYAFCKGHHKNIEI